MQASASQRYNPRVWYWLAKDGRIFSSITRQFVTSTDPNYVRWLAKGNTPAPWPGDQSNAALDRLLNPLGIYVDLKTYAAKVRYDAETGGITLNGAKVATDRASQAQLNGAYGMAQANPSFTVRWKGPDGSFSPSLSAAQITTMAEAVGAHVQACFDLEADTVAAIDAGTITNCHQVKTAFTSIKM